MPRILFGVSPIGLGHATRALVLADALGKMGAEVRFFSGGNAAEFLRLAGMPVEDVVEDPVPSTSNLEMKWVVLWYIRSWIANRRTVRRTEKLFETYAPDLVVCDEEWSGLTIAGKRGVKRVLVADELQLGFARTWLARRVENRVENWYKKLQDSVDLLIVPETGQDSGNRRFVGPIVRERSLDCDAIRSKYGLPPGRMVLFSMSGSGIGSELVRSVKEAMQKPGMKGTALVVAGNRRISFGDEGVFDLGLVTDNQNLVACADLVISTAGKSIIDEAGAAGTPIIVIPIRHHAEQERNAKAIGYSYDTLENLPDLMEAKLGKREPPQAFRGEQVASRLIMSLL